MNNIGWFILEHPQGAASWKTEDMEKLLQLPGVQVPTLDQCEYGLLSRDEHGVAPARKSTKLATNLSLAQLVLSQRCRQDHRHVQLVNGKA